MTNLSMRSTKWYVWAELYKWNPVPTCIHLNTQLDVGYLVEFDNTYLTLRSMSTDEALDPRLDQQWYNFRPAAHYRAACCVRLWCHVCCLETALVLFVSMGEVRWGGGWGGWERETLWERQMIPCVWKDRWFNRNWGNALWLQTLETRGDVRCYSCHLE